MISLTITHSVFQPTTAATELAGIYAISAQTDVALDWVGRHSIRIGQYLFYMRVVSSAVDAALAFNALVAEYRISNSDVPAVAYMDDDWIDRDCICDLSRMLEMDPYSESWLIERMTDYINQFPLTGDAAHLRPLEAVQ